MASTMIHLVIAKELKDKLKIKNAYDYYLGSIAPDLAKQIGLSRNDSHFLINSFDDVPNIDAFKNKYPNFRSNDYDLGYFVHLYTDKLWTEDYLKNYTFENSIKLLDGTTIQASKDEIKEFLYSDYTNLNVQLVDEYDVDLSIFYEEFKVPNTEITEIPKEKLDILINKMGILISNSKETKSYFLDIFSIKQFIENTVEEIEKELRSS